MAVGTVVEAGRAAARGQVAELAGVATAVAVGARAAATKVEEARAVAGTAIL